jgi:hypothetical protein
MQAKDRQKTADLIEQAMSDADQQLWAEIKQDPATVESNLAIALALDHVRFHLYRLLADD